jgi:ABC-2 type transport system ATP-binding protein
MYTVELEKVTKSFGDHVAVDGLSLAVPAGSIYGFIGPNGSGKTTTLRLILNIFYPDAGAIRLFGRETPGVANDRIGYLPEERGLYRKMKVRDVLRFYGRLKNGRDVDRQAAAWLDRLGLTDWANKRIEALSKGMSQKVQFIAAVVARPDLVILDEPFTGLDPVNMDALTEAILQLRDRGATVIFSTHDMHTAERLCDFILMIYKGRKVLDGTLSSIQDRYASDLIRVRLDGNGVCLTDLPGVEAARDLGQVQELRLAHGANPQMILAAIMAKGRVRQFELARPSLHDIFVRIAGPEAQEASHA